MKRIDFLKRSIMFAGGAMVVPRFFHPILAQTSQRTLREAFNNKTVVIINLSGGNDGLNTVIPYSNDIYHQLRPSIAIPQNQVLQLSNTLGLHPDMSALHSLWNNGKLAVLENVGYDFQNLSHFRSTDIWRSGSDSNEVISTGWIARFIESVLPDVHSNPPDDPAAFQIGNSNTLQLTGNEGMPGVLVEDPETFYQIVNETYDDPTLDENFEMTAGKEEVSFIRQISALSFNYADVIQEASVNGQNTESYANNTPGKYLKIIAKLISGGMYCPFYLVHHGGFDNHADQPDTHAGLLERLSTAMASFKTDLQNQGIDDNVLIMTTSEFGRRTFENGASGTDHGGSAPHFVLGNNLNSEIFGGDPDLENLDDNENLVHTIDYRQVYSSIITEWFGYNNETVANVFSQQFDSLGIMDG